VAVRIRHYVTPAGRSPVEEFILALPAATVSEVQHAVLMLTEGVTLTMPLSRPMTGIHPGLHELRFRDAAGQVRIFYYIKKGEGICLLHAFRKKTRETPKKEIDLVSKRIKELNR
jgi:phage-related protein